MIKILLPGIWLLVSSFYVNATTVFEESFTTYAGRGLSPGGSHGTLDSQRWQIFGASQGDSVSGEHALHGDFARGITVGGVRSGGVYAALLPDGKRALAVQPTAADFTPGALLWTLNNHTDRWLNHLLLSFELWWLNDGNRSTTVETLFSADGSTWELLSRQQTPSTVDNFGWQLRNTSVPIEPLAAAHAERYHTQSPGLAPGAPFWLRWQISDLTGGGSRDELALTALRIQAPGKPRLVNEPSTLWISALASALLIIMPGQRTRRSGCKNLSRRERRASLSTGQTSTLCNASDTCA